MDFLYLAISGLAEALWCFASFNVGKRFLVFFRSSLEIFEMLVNNSFYSICFEEHFCLKKPCGLKYLAGLVAGVRVPCLAFCFCPSWIPSL